MSPDISTFFLHRIAGKPHTEATSRYLTSLPYGSACSIGMSAMDADTMQTLLRQRCSPIGEVEGSLHGYDQSWQPFLPPRDQVGAVPEEDLSVSRCHTLQTLEHVTHRTRHLADLGHDAGKAELWMINQASCI